MSIEINTKSPQNPNNACDNCIRYILAETKSSTLSQIKLDIIHYLYGIDDLEAIKHIQNYIKKKL